jgi:hypothetical protein
MDRTPKTWRELEAIVLEELRSRPTSANATAIVVHRAEIVGDWFIGPVGFFGEKPPTGVAEVIDQLRGEFQIAA